MTPLAAQRALECRWNRFWPIREREFWWLVEWGLSLCFMEMSIQTEVEYWLGMEQTYELARWHP